MGVSCRQDKLVGFAWRAHYAVCPLHQPASRRARIGAHAFESEHHPISTTAQRGMQFVLFFLFVPFVSSAAIISAHLG